MPKRLLTHKQLAFVSQYLVDLNATQAAIRAGYSPKTADSYAIQLLRKSKVAAAIEENARERQQRTEITANMVVLELAKVAFRDASDVVTWGPGGVRLKDSDELADDVRSSVAEVSETTTKDGGTQRVKLHDKMKALELLGKHMPGFFTTEQPTNETNVNVLVQSPDWVALRNRIIRALQPYPEARAAVVDALKAAKLQGVE